MAQVFHRSTNTIAKASIYGGAFIVVLLVWVFTSLDRSSYNTRQGVTLKQPVPFSHDHHTAGLGIDCRYCHTAVEESAFAGLPPTQTCMNCHSQIWATADLLAPVRESWTGNRPIAWRRVNDLPDFVYFNHSIHVARGVACTTCHGAVDRMPLLRQAVSLQMEWCLACHRHPERFVRPREEVFNWAWQSPEPQQVLGARLVDEYGIERLTHCSTCHR